MTNLKMAPASNSLIHLSDMKSSRDDGDQKIQGFSKRAATMEQNSRMSSFRCGANKNGRFSNPFLLCVFFVFVLHSVSGVSCLMDYCSTNTFETNSTWLQLTKEVTTSEYAVVNDFKSLHCCSKGYRSIEW